MNDAQKNSVIPPFKSIAVSLLFCVVLGPVGVLYSSVGGGIVMILFGLLALRAKLIAPALLVWLASCVWGVSAANRYNKKVLHNKL